MFRKLVLVWVVYTLLTPPGVCTCGAVRREGGESRFCNNEFADTGLASHFERAKTNGRPCSGRHGVPNGDQCPPGCPGNQKTDHSKFAEQSPVVPDCGTAIYLPTLCVDTFSVQRIQTTASLLPPSAQPIYITLCTLLI